MTFALPPVRGVKFGAFKQADVVKAVDFGRIQNLPARKGEFYPADLIAQLTALLKTPGGEQTLFDVQARALYDLGKSGEAAHGGRYRLFAPIKVAGGKSLISLLAPRMVTGVKRPRLILPASLVLPTVDKMRVLGKHWRVANHMKIWSYQKIGRKEGQQMLDIDQPDMLILDEAHFAKNPHAAVTRKLARYFKEHPSTVFVILTGTPMKDSIKNFAHLLAWGFGQHSPLPLNAEALKEWAQALDEGLNPLEQRSPGALLDLYPPALSEIGPSADPIVRARQVFKARLNDTLGVIVADGKDEYGGSLEITSLEYEPNAATDENFARLRDHMERPDGWTLSEKMQEWAVARMLALGLHYFWDPAAPDEWLLARKLWAARVRDILKSPRSMREGWDSELLVTNAVLNGNVEDEFGLLADWQAIRPTFDIHAFPEWHDDTALNLCAKWLANHDRGICWVDHKFFGAKLSKMTGVTYYGAKGLDPKGDFVEHHPKGPIILSSAANKTGRDLQHKWDANLITAPAPDSDWFEQLMARTHRYGQKADTVTVEVLVGCREHLESIPRALSAGDVKKDLLGFSQKLMLADLIWPDDNTPRTGRRWS